MILFFTGTGNSRYVAEVLAERTNDSTISLNLVLKAGLDPHFESEKPFVVVAPIHTWRLPEVVTDLLRNATFVGSRKIYFIATMESDTGSADKHCKNLAEELGMDFMGFRGIKMPDNCVYLSTMPTPDRANAIIESSLPLMNATAQTIVEGGTISKEDSTFASGLKSGNLMHSFYKRFIETDKGYEVSGKCVGCGRCAELCPLNNIAIEGSRPTFKGNCCACYACIHHCPTQAIEIKGHSEGHGRYVCPERHLQ